MREKDKFFAIVPIHETNALVEAPTVDELENGINDVLRRPELSFPFHNFKEGIRVIKGREIKLPQSTKKI